MNELFEKLNGVMTGSDIQALTESVNSVVQEQLIVERAKIQRELDTRYAADFKSKLTEAVNKERSILITEYDGKMQQLEERTIATVSEILDAHVKDQISDELLENVAMVEAFAPVITGMRKVLVENGIDFSKSNFMNDTIATLKKDQNDLMESVSNLTAQLDKTTAYLLMSETTRTLSDDSRKLLFESFKGMKYAEIKPRLESQIKILKESEDVAAKLLIRESQDNKKKAILKESSDKPAVVKTKSKVVTGSALGAKTSGSTLINESTKAETKVDEQGSTLSESKRSLVNAGARLLG